jgi:hypothetical protein
MKKFTFLFLCIILFAFIPGAQVTSGQKRSPGFASVTPLDPVSISSHTADKPQAKVWTYAEKWWSVLATEAGTKLFRLDGTSWTDVLTLSTAGNSKADCRVVDNITHILLFRGGTTSYLYSVEYDPTSGTYKLWSQRPSRVLLALEAEAETATLTLDGAGRMWIASDGAGEVNMRWSDAPYTTWSAPIKVASGINEDDICAVTTLPGKIGVFFSNQKTERFGFKTHTDGTDPASWSADEVPAGQSALNIGNGMADDHLAMTVASNGTLYCAVKTGYDSPSYPKIALLIRRPSGTWDNLLSISTSEGTRPIVILNEEQGKLKVIYTSQEGGGDILYREASTSSLFFSPPIKLLEGTYNYVSSTHQTYSSEVVILATNQGTSPIQAVSVLAKDDSSNSQSLVEAEFIAYPNPFSVNTQMSFLLPESGTYTITLYDAKGTKVSVLKQGRAEAGMRDIVVIEGNKLPSGVYFARLQSGKSTKTLKLLFNR